MKGGQQQPGAPAPDTGGEAVTQSLHIYGPTAYNSVRVRAWCPAHDKQHLAAVTSYYDRWLIRFDCGALVEASDGTWIPDVKGFVSSERHQNLGRRRRIRKGQWERWKPYIVPWLKRIPSERDYMQAQSKEA